MENTAFAYAGLTGNALIDRLGTDVSHRLLAFSRVVRLEAREALHAPGAYRVSRASRRTILEKASSRLETSVPSRSMSELPVSPA